MKYTIMKTNEGWMVEDASTGDYLYDETQNNCFDLHEDALALIDKAIGSSRGYTVDDLFFSVNQTYTAFDSGEVELEDAESQLKRCCEAFIQYLNQKKGS